MKTIKLNQFFLTIKSLFPQSLASQFIWLLLFTLLISQVITAFILINERKEALTVLNRKGNMNRIISTVRVLEESPKELHKKILHAVSSENMQYWFKTPDKDQMVNALKLDQEFLDRFTKYGINKLLIVNSTDNEIKRKKHSFSKKINNSRYDSYPHKQFEWSQIAIQLKDGRWLNVASRFHPTPPFWSVANLISLVITGGLLVLLSIFMIRRITKPLSQLTQAAKKLGCGDTVDKLNETGPEDIKTASIAFNQMNERLERFITDRTNMLAAVSHDLRTPITTLRLRTELMDEGPTQTAFLNTLDEMQAITDSTLSFIREDNSTEPNQLIDLNMMLKTICDDFIMKGKDVNLESETSHFYLCRSLAMKRALVNLIENAINYGKQTQITIEKSASELKINISDQGPGIDEKNIEEVFKPFVRLDKSRNHAKGGMGLGLAITRSIIRNHGGEIILVNKTEGGLLAIVSLPIV